jgi:hypothetical protein
MRIDVWNEIAQPFGKILCSVDFDANSLAAFDFAVAHAKQNGARVRPMYAAD